MSEQMYGAMFQYDGFACHCECDIENMTPGYAPKATLKMYEDHSNP